MVAEGLVDYLIIDSTWAGGLTTWREAGVMAELYHMSLAPTTTRRSTSTRWRRVRPVRPGVVRRSTRDPLWIELFHQRPGIVDGFMAVPEAPGLGLELREETLEKYGVKLG